MKYLEAALLLGLNGLQLLYWHFYAQFFAQEGEKFLT
jgi:hypothetical protein